MQHGRSHRPLTGILLACAAMTCFSVQDAMIKSLASDYSLLQILFMRSVFMVAPLFLFLFLRRGIKGFRTARKKDHALRVFYNLVAFFSYYFALSRLPLGNTTAIALSVPLFLVLLSGPLLGEHADWRRKAMVAVGFIGVLIVIPPDLRPSDMLGAGAALLGAFMFAMLAVQTRKMTATEDTELMVFWAATTFFCVTGACMPFVWRAPGADLYLLLGVGCVTLCAQYCIVHAYQFAAVYVIGPFEYIIIFWALLFGWLFFDEIPTPMMLSGCLLIIACGLVIAAWEHREHRLAAWQKSMQ